MNVPPLKLQSNVTNHIRKQGPCLNMLNQPCAMKKSTVVGHRKALRIEENQEWILGLMSFLLGMVPFGRLAYQPAQRAEEPAIFMDGSSPMKMTSTLKYTPDFPQSAKHSYALQQCSFSWHTAAHASQLFTLV